MPESSEWVQADQSKWTSPEGSNPATSRSITDISGILSGLELGNVHKHLSLHCDSNIIHFLESHVKKTWLDITGNDPSVQRYVDPVTVRRLQFRVPAASVSDRRSITQMFDDGDIFTGISDTELRERVKQNVLALKVVIPSVESFHENMKFFSLGMKLFVRILLIHRLGEAGWRCSCKAGIYLPCRTSRRHTDGSSPSGNLISQRSWLSRNCFLLLWETFLTYAQSIPVRTEEESSCLRIHCHQ